jgi:hypothetical protein
MHYYLFFYIIKSIILFFSFELVEILKISYIVGSFKSNFSFLTAVTPIIFNSSLIGKFFLFSKFYNSNLILKIPSIINIISFKFLNIYKTYTKIILLLLFIISSIVFIYIFKRTIIYTTPWIICSFYIIITFKKKYNIIEIATISTWTSQCLGTIIYGYYQGYLTNECYTILLPKTIIERSLFVLILILYYYFTININLLLNKLFNKYKKNSIQKYEK